ncbi:MAG: hypothetical protein DWQ02_06130 [Bacteroidetes bacterium]|nr:MAG: hypothetical protein DWQ02_06130 [Bacteroidota bacterium]
MINCFPSLAQQVINVEEKVEGNIHLAEGISIPKINPGYTLWAPETGEVKGLIVFTRSRRDTINSDVLIDEALKNHLAVLYATTDNRLEFFFETSRMQEIEKYIFQAVSQLDIPKQNILFCGMSLEGTRALKLATFSQSEVAKYHLKPMAIAICDAPLDMIRFHKEMVKAKTLEFHASATNEGYWVSSYLEKNLGGTPEDNLEAYIQYSPYNYLNDGGPNVEALSEISIRAYTEPDVQWWMETRRKDYYAMNSIDLAALINTLNIKGNSNAELILTENKGYLWDGRRHPHSWSIVDEPEMIQWFLKLIGEK